MRSIHRMIIGLVLGAGGCAQILKSDALYYLDDGGGAGAGLIGSAGSGGVSGAGGESGSSGGMAGAGGGGNGVCTTVADCPKINVECIAPICINDVCGTTNAQAGTFCQPGASGVCDGNGTCVQCFFPQHCVDITEDECVKRECVNQECKPKYAVDGTLASATLQTPGDCQKVVCDGLGKTKSVADDSDVPNDGNACSMGTCSSGTPQSMNLPQGSPCGVNLVCNAVGQCLGCLTAVDCAGMDDACKQRSCIGGVCGTQYTTANTMVPVAGQTAQDCKIAVCDGNGNIVFSPDVTDVPVDNNVCTQDVCSANGTPSNPPAPTNTQCGSNNSDRCDGNGLCKKSNGKTCTIGTECVSAFCVDGYCCDSTCTTTCRACNVNSKLGTCSSVPSGQDDTNAGTPCSGSTMSCNGMGSCKLDNAQPCTQNSNCISDRCVDGYCCTSSCTSTCKACNVAGNLGSCANIPFGSDDTNATTMCSGLTVSCDGASFCKKENGETCTLASECLNGICTGTPMVCSGP